MNSNRIYPFLVREFISPDFDRITKGIVEACWREQGYDGTSGDSENRGFSKAKPFWRDVDLIAAGKVYFLRDGESPAYRLMAEAPGGALMGLELKVIPFHFFDKGDFETSQRVAVAVSALFVVPK